MRSEQETAASLGARELNSDARKPRPGTTVGAAVDSLAPAYVLRGSRPRASLLRPAARRAIRNRMLLLRTAAVARVQRLTGATEADLRRFRHELTTSDLPDTLLARGAGPAFVQELPQGGLLYLLVRALAPRHVVETGVRPGYSTAWILAALEANGSGHLTSLGPGSGAGRSTGVHDVSVGQFVAPALRGRWTLELGNTEENLERILTQGGAGSIELFFYDNGPEVERARFELRTAWSCLSPRGVLVAHHVDANSAWGELCRRQGLPSQLLDAGPPPLGALAVRVP